MFLSEADIQKTVTLKKAIDLVEKGIRADAAVKDIGDKFYSPIGEAGFIKPFTGYIAGEDYFLVKTFTFFPQNPDRFELPTTGSQVMLFDARNGLPVCLMEAGWVTSLKTGASTAVTASILADPSSKTATIFGAGLQGRMHIRALAQQFELRKVWLIDIVPEVAIAAVDDLQSNGVLNVEAIPLENREAVVRKSDIVITVTTGDQTLIQQEGLQPNAFIAKLGSYTEIALDVILKADKVIVDNWHYVSPRIPELKQLRVDGRFGLENIHAEWADIVGGRKVGRESSNETIVYIALGIWGEYAAILPEVYRQEKQKKLGHKISLSI